MSFDETRINLSQISTDERFRITTRTDCDDLCDSVRHIGLINPPILFPSDTGFVVVCGFRRIEACRKLQIAEIPARIIDASESECLKLAISDNAFQRQLNLIEISRSLYKLSVFIKNDSDLSHISASLGLPSILSLIRRMRGLCQMPQMIQEGILSEAIALPTATELQKLDQNDAIAIAELFKQLVPSLNKQREILTLLLEISIREEIPIRSLLHELNNMTADSETDRNQKLREIRIYLKQRRLPNLSRAEEQFEAWIKQLKLGNGIGLIPPKYFEGDMYTFTLQFRTSEELDQRKKQLDNVIGNPAVKNYFGGDLQRG